MLAPSVESDGAELQLRNPETLIIHNVRLIFFILDSRRVLAGIPRAKRISTQDFGLQAIFEKGSAVTMCDLLALVIAGQVRYELSEVLRVRARVPECD